MSNQVRLAVLAATLASGAVLAPLAGTATSAPVTRLAIVHNVRGCHVWGTNTKTLGPSARLTLKVRTALVIRLSDPMSFDFAQVAGPKLALGDPHSVAGTRRTIVFQRRGLYRLKAASAQSSDELGLETLGSDNGLSLVVAVR